jgi:Domain of unknown function (DUF6378)
MSAKDLLEAAAAIVSQDRRNLYGPAERSFELIADLWSAYLRQPISPTQVAVMMSLLKVARTVSAPQHADSWIDGAGYMGLAGELALEDNAPEDLNRTS